MTVLYTRWCFDITNLKLHEFTLKKKLEKIRVTLLTSELDSTELLLF